MDINYDTLQNDIVNHLRDKWKNSTCNICQTNEWSFVEGVFQLQSYSIPGQKYTFSDRIVPLIPVICKNCGNTILINAINVGVISMNTKEEGGNDDK